MDGPWYQFDGPDINKESDYDLIIKDFKKNIESNFTQYLIDKLNTDMLYITVLNNTVYEMFSNKHYSWRGYATFKSGIMHDTCILLINNLSYINRLRRSKIVKHYINNFKDRYYAPPINNKEGGKGYYILASNTLIGKTKL